MEKIEHITIKLSIEDKEHLDKYGTITLFDDNDPIITVKYDND